MSSFGLAFGHEPLESVLPSMVRESPAPRPKDLREPADAEGTGDGAAALALAVASVPFGRFPDSRGVFGKRW